MHPKCFLQARTIVLVVVATQAGLWSCSRSEASKPAPAAYIHADYDSMGKLRRLDYDRNKNGRNETVAYMDGTRIVRIEIDSDENGLVDRWEYYADQKLTKVGSSSAGDGKVDTWAYQSPSGTLQRIEVSTKRDGRVSRTEFYEEGALVSAEEDSDGDGKLDKWESYSDGTLTKVAFDTQGRGKPDRQIVYSPAGVIDRIEGDPDGDGIFTALSGVDGSPSRKTARLAEKRELVKP